MESATAFAYTTRCACAAPMGSASASIVVAINHERSNIPPRMLTHFNTATLLQLSILPFTAMGDWAADSTHLPQPAVRRTYGKAPATASVASDRLQLAQPSRAVSVTQTPKLLAPLHGNVPVVPGKVVVPSTSVVAAPSLISVHVTDDNGVATTPPAMRVMRHVPAATDAPLIPSLQMLPSSRRRPLLKARVGIAAAKASHSAQQRQASARQQASHDMNASSLTATNLASTTVRGAPAVTSPHLNVSASTREVNMSTVSDGDTTTSSASYSVRSSNLTATNQNGPTTRHELNTSNVSSVCNSTGGAISKLEPSTKSAAAVGAAWIAAASARARQAPLAGSSHNVNITTSVAAISSAPLQATSESEADSDADESDDAFDVEAQFGVAASSASMQQRERMFRRVSMGAPALLRAPLSRFSGAAGVRGSSVFSMPQAGAGELAASDSLASLVRLNAATAVSLQVSAPKYMKPRNDIESQQLSTLRSSAMKCEASASVSDACLSLDPEVQRASESSDVEHRSVKTAEALTRELAAIFSFLDTATLRTGPPSQVCSTWRRVAQHVLSWRAAEDMCVERRGAAPVPARQRRRAANAPPSQLLPRAVPVLSSWEPFLLAFPWASFLAEGAYKLVFRVWAEHSRRLEAISVMDVRALEESQQLPVVRAELQAACLVSELVRTGVSPHFVETYSVFTHERAPHIDFPGLWGEPAAPTPLGPTCPFTRDHPLSAWREQDVQLPLTVAAIRRSLAALVSTPTVPTEGEFQYIRMELCTGGDVEGYLRREENVVAAAEAEANTAAAAVEPALVHATSNLASRTKDIIGSTRTGDVRASRSRKTDGASVVPTPTSTSSTRARRAANVPTNTVADNDVPQGRREGSVDAGTSVNLAASTTSAASAVRLAALDVRAAEFFRTILFQTAHALYAARERLTMRHHDVKMLNLLLVPAADAVSASASHGCQTVPEYLHLHYGFGTISFDIRLSTRGDDAGYIVKLADYGTADTQPETMGALLKPYHFTTIENAPPEYLVLGDEARVGYGADTWALGLCALHALTGSGPVEESLAGARCPTELRIALEATWRGSHAVPQRRGGHSTSNYRALRVILDSGDNGALADSLYRAFVLVAGASRDDEAGEALATSANPVWSLLQSCGIVTDRAASATARRAAAASSGERSMSRAATANVRARFASDVALYSLLYGSHGPLVRARRRMLAAGPGAAEIVLQLLSVRPDRRPTMRAVLCSRLFAPLRSPQVANTSDAWKDDDSTHHLVFATYSGADADVVDV